MDATPFQLQALDCEISKAPLIIGDKISLGYSWQGLLTYTLEIFHNVNYFCLRKNRFAYFAPLSNIEFNNP